MNDPKNAELAGIIEKQLMLAQRLFDAVNEAMSRDVQLLGRTGNAAVMVSGLMENYYWDRVEFVLKKLRDVHLLVRVDLERFLEFLLALDA